MHHNHIYITFYIGSQAMALPYACGCAIAGTAIRATSRPISPSGLNTVSGFFDQFARLRRWRRHCGRRERTSVRPLALGLAALNTHQTDKKAFVTRYVALLHTRFGRAMSLCSIRALVALCRFAPYALLARLCAHWRCAHTPRVAPPPTPLPIGAGELNPIAIRESGRLAVVMAPCALMDWR